MGNPEAREQGIKVLAGLTKEQRDSVTAFIKDVTKEAIGDIYPVLSDRLQQSGYTEEVGGLVQLLAAKSGDSRESVLKKALTLYGLALDARQKGNRLAVLSPDDDILQEITGFDVTEEQPVG